MTSRTHTRSIGKTIRAFFILFAFSAAVFANDDQEEFIGRVVKVTLGDMLTVQRTNKTRIGIRLADIDAPEQKQPYWQESRKSLSEMCSGQQARIKITGKDHNGRILGRVYCQDKDTSAEQVKRGMAWVYTQYKDNRLNAYQMQAQRFHSGIWADKNPIPPWQWR